MFTGENKEYQLQENNCLHIEPSEKHTLNAVEEMDKLVFQI